MQDQLGVCGLLQGNDNKVGAAGEYWAMKYYRSKGYEIIEVPRSNNAAYDFKCRRDKRTLRISVKVISDENRRGTQLRLKKSNLWDTLFVVLLSDTLQPYKRGFASRRQFEIAQRNGSIRETPTIARRSLNQRGWLTIYGKVEDWS